MGFLVKTERVIANNATGLFCKQIICLIRNKQDLLLLEHFSEYTSNSETTTTGSKRLSMLPAPTNR